MHARLRERTAAGNTSLAVAFITLLAIGTDLFVVSPLLPAIAHHYRVVPGVADNAVTLFSLAYLLAAPALGLLADRLGCQRMVLVGLLGFAAANILTGLAPGFIFFLVMCVAAGCAAAAVTPNVQALVGQVAPAERRGKWMSLAVAGFLLSLVIGAPIGTVVASLLSWRITFVGIGLVTMLLTGINRLAWTSEVQTAHLHTRTSASEPIPLASILRVVTVTGLWAFAVYSVYTYLGTGLRTQGFTTGSLAAALILYGVGAVVGSLGSGHLIDRYGASRMVLLSFVLLAVAGALHARAVCPHGLSLFSRLSMPPGDHVSPAHGFGLCLEQLFSVSGHIIGSGRGRSSSDHTRVPAHRAGCRGHQSGGRALLQVLGLYPHAAP
jgi:predicted MFS family arabinose efflux permease